MCFTPQISLLTAAVEFLLVIIILLRFRKSFVTRFIPVFIFLLGFYQFTEFMFCITPFVDFWGRAGFITYTFLPALALHFIYRLSDRKHKAIIFYLPAIIFSAFAIFSRGFVSNGLCHSVFISVNLTFLSPSVDFILQFIYTAYYAGFIFLTCLLAGLRIQNEKNLQKKRKLMLGLGGVLLATIPALLFIIILPSFIPQFPSLYCEFALLMALAGYWVCYLDHKEHQKN